MLVALNVAKETIGANPASVRPVALWRSASPTSDVDVTTSLAVARVLTRIARGSSLVETQDSPAERDDPVACEAVATVYRQFCGDAPSASSPAQDARGHARAALGRYELHLPHGRDR